VVAAAVDDRALARRHVHHLEAGALEVVHVVGNPDVNSTDLPSGNHCGQRWLTSASASSVTGCGWPPADDTRMSPLRGDGAKTMVSSAPQVAPRLRSTLHRVMGAPPAVETFLSSVGVT
jgi:hypothetical protein